MHPAVQLLAQMINFQPEISCLLLMGNMTSSPWLASVGVVFVLHFHLDTRSSIMLSIFPPLQADKVVYTLQANRLLSILSGVSNSLDKKDCRWFPIDGTNCKDSKRKAQGLLRIVMPRSSNQAQTMNFKESELLSQVQC